MVSSGQQLLCILVPIERKKRMKKKEEREKREGRRERRGGTNEKKAERVGNVFKGA